jgi:putative membrane protein
LAFRPREPCDDPNVPELLARFVGNLAALWVASEVFDQMTYGDSFWVLVLAALVFTIVNWIVKPVVAILSIPLIIVTLGVAYFFVNVLMLLVTDWVVPDFEAGGFWTVVGATIVIWLVNLVIAAFLQDVGRTRGGRPDRRGDGRPRG